MNVNIIISNNILSVMKEKGKKKEDLAAAMRMSKTETTWLLSGRRVINAVELKLIAEFLGVEVKELTKLPSSLSSSLSSPSILSEKEKEREEVKEAVEIAEELAEMVEFHERVKENGEEMRKG